MNNSKQKKLKIAVFDIDETLLIGTSAEIQLIRFLYKKNLINIRNIVKSVIHAIISIFQGIDQVIYRKSGYLKGLEKRTVITHLPQLFDQYIWPRVSRKLLNDIEKLKSKNYEIVIISGTLDFLLDPFIEKIGADGGIGSHMETKNGKFSGKITGVYPYRKGKVKALKQYLKGQKIDYTHSCAYADSFADLPLLKLFGNPVAVNPSFLLWLQAKLKGWEIMRIKI